MGSEVNICLTCGEVSLSTPGVQLLKKCAFFLLLLAADKVEMGMWWETQQQLRLVTYFNGTLSHFLRLPELWGPRDGSLGVSTPFFQRPGLWFPEPTLRTAHKCLHLTPAAGDPMALLPSAGTCMPVANVHTDVHMQV